MSSRSSITTWWMSEDVKERIREILKELGGWERMRGSCYPRFIQPGDWLDGPDVEVESVAAEDIPNWAMRYVATMIVSMEVVLKITGLSERTLRQMIADGVFPAPSPSIKEGEYWYRVEVRAWFDTVLLVASHIESNTLMSRDLAGEPYYTKNGSRVVVLKGGGM